MRGVVNGTATSGIMKDMVVVPDGRHAYYRN